MPFGQPDLLNKKVVSELAEYDVGALLEETTQIHAIDLAQYMPHLEESFLAMLNPAPTGVYYINSVEPILSFDHQTYYSHKTLVSGPKVPDIRSFDDFVRSAGPVYDGHLRPVAFSSKQIIRSIQPYPTYNWAGYHVILIAIMEYFNRLCRIIDPYTNIPHDWLKLERYVKPQHLQSTMVVYEAIRQLSAYSMPQYERIEATFHPESSRAICGILDEIHMFVGREKHHVYRIKVSGMTVYIEKGIDARVVEYHRMIQAHMESIRDEHQLPMRHY